MLATAPAPATIAPVDGNSYTLQFINPSWCVCVWADDLTNTHIIICLRLQNWKEKVILNAYKCRNCFPFSSTFSAELFFLLEAASTASKKILCNSRAHTRTLRQCNFKKWTSRKGNNILFSRAILLMNLYEFMKLLLTVVRSFFLFFSLAFTWSFLKHCSFSCFRAIFSYKE